MKDNSKVVKVAAVALLAVTLASQAVAATSGTRVQAEEVEFTKAVSVSQTAVVEEFTEDKYTKTQVEFLISQIVADNSESEEIDEIRYTYSDLYYSPENKAGYVIDFTCGDFCGYIIMLVDENASTPSEIVLNRRSPYYGKSGTYLYPAQGNHFIMAENGDVVQALQYTELSNKSQNVVMMSSKNDDGGKKPYEEINYYSLCSFQKRDIQDFDFHYSTEDVKSHVNVCANIAGVISLNYWNKYFNNDILNLEYHENKVNSFGNMSRDKAVEYANIFYDYMNTNNWFPYSFDKYGGTFYLNCYSGFERLIRENGYQTKRVSTPTYDLIRLNIMYDIPVFITAQDFYFGDLRNDEKEAYLKYDGYQYTGISMWHTFIAYGYVEYKLSDKNNNDETYNFVKVADGWGGTQYFYIEKGKIISAAAIQVYKTTLSRC